MMCLKPLDLDIDFEKLKKEYFSQPLMEFKLEHCCSCNDDYYDHVTDWHHFYPDLVEGSELNRIVDQVNTKAGKPIISHVQYYRLDANASLPMHKDPMRTTRCAVSILLDESGPITFEKIGDVDYRVALLDVSRCSHTVKPYPKDRHQVKLSIAKYSFDQVSEWI
jgi:hypothetical protein